MYLQPAAQLKRFIFLNMNKIPKSANLILFGLIIIAVFISGVAIGLRYHDYDVLCDNKPIAHILKKNLKSSSGLYLPKGTIVPLQECKHADRFTLKFYLSHLPENTDAFVPFKPETDDDLENLRRKTIYQYGLEVD